MPTCGHVMVTCLLPFTRTNRMRCPFCRARDSKVTDSRANDDGIRRRRQCIACGERFSTFELVQLSNLQIVKKDGRREDFSREKLLAGLRKACAKREVSVAELEAVVAEIEARITASNAPEVPSALLGEMAMDALRRLDHIAYIRFASVYRQFVSVEELLLELHQLSQTAETPPADQPRLFEDELSELVDGDDDLPVIPTPIELAPSVLARL